MQILTPTGNKPIEEIQVGDDVLAFDVFTGEQIINQVLDKTLWNFSPESPFFDGKFYIINGTWKCYGEQSIWRNDNQVVHIKNLVVGDIIFNGSDEDVVVTSIEETTDTQWYKFEISGDHSYIVDNLTLHNASRFWVGGTGTWDSSTTTHWAATSNGAGGSSVPGSADTATFDASSGGGTVTPDYDMTVTSITMGAFTGTLTFATNNNSPTMSTFSCSGTGTRTLSMGSGTWTMTGNATTIWTTATTTNLTLNAGTSTVVCNYSGSSGTRTITTGASSSFGLNNLSITAGTDTISLSSAFINGNLNYTGFAGSQNGNTMTVSGSIIFGSAMTWLAGANIVTLNGTGSHTITTNGTLFPRNLSLTGTGTYTLQDDLNFGTGIPTAALNLTAGTLNANDKNITAPFFNTSNSNVRTLSLGSGTMTLTGTGTVFTAATSTNLTLTTSTSTINITDTSATSKTFAGGSKTYYNLTATGDNIIVSGSNTFNTLRLANAGLTTGLSLTAGTTQTVSSMTNNGSAGNLTKLISTSAGTPAIISKTSGNVSLDYMSIKDSTATGGAVFYAGANSTNVSGNTGWFFVAAPSGGTGIGSNVANFITNAIMI